MSIKKFDSIVDPIILAASRLEAIANRFIYEPMGLTVASGKVLKVLAREKNGCLTPTEVVKFTGGTKSNISQRIAFLEKKGLIKRAIATGGDRRQIAVHITAAGRSTVAKVKKIAERPSAELAQHFTAKEVAAHASFYEKLFIILDNHDGQIEDYFPPLQK